MPLYVKNWRRFQHYKERRPPWIKLHRELLDDFEFLRLPLASQALAPRLWLLASESEDGAISHDPEKLAFRLHCTQAESIEAVRSMISGGFLECSPDASTALAECLRRAMPERETETEERHKHTAPNGAGLVSGVTLLVTENHASSHGFVADSKIPDDCRTYVMAVDAVFGRRTRVIAADVVKSYKARSRDWEPWEILATPLLVKAQGSWTLPKPPSPIYFLRDGEHARTSNGNTYAARYWIARAIENIDGTKLDKRLTYIAEKLGILQTLVDRGCVAEENAA